MACLLPAWFPNLKCSRATPDPSRRGCVGCQARKFMDYLIQFPAINLCDSNSDSHFINEEMEPQGVEVPLSVRRFTGFYFSLSDVETKAPSSWVLDLSANRELRVTVFDVWCGQTHEKKGIYKAPRLTGSKAYGSTISAGGEWGKLPLMRASLGLVFSFPFWHSLIPNKETMCAAPFPAQGRSSRPQLGDVLIRTHTQAFHRFVMKVLRSRTACQPSGTSQARTGHCDWAAHAGH